MLARNTFLRYLRELLVIRSYFGDEGQIAVHCQNVLRSIGFQAEIGSDLPNVIANRKNKPHLMLNAHLDTFLKIGKNVATPEQIEKKAATQDEIDTLFARLLQPGNNEHIRVNGKHLGLDDKVGIALILTIAETLKECPFKVLLIAQEEHNQNGARHLDGEIFKGIRYGITLDRMNGSDVIIKYQHKCLCGINFLDRLLRLGQNIPLNVAIGGTRADALVLAYGSPDDRIYNHSKIYEVGDKRRLECVNLSTGVYNDHRINDNCDIEQALTMGNLVCALLNELQDNLPPDN